MVKNDRFSPFFGPKTPFFGIFWHPENPPSKTPFLAVLTPPLPPARQRTPRPSRRDFSNPSEQACVFFSTFTPLDVIELHFRNGRFTGTKTPISVLFM